MPTDLSPVDDELARVLADQRRQQRETLSLIASLLDSPENEAVRKNAADVVRDLCRAFPLYDDAEVTVEP